MITAFKKPILIGILGGVLIAGLYLGETYAIGNVLLAGDTTVEGQLDVTGTISSPTIIGMQGQLVSLASAAGGIEGVPIITQSSAGAGTFTTTVIHEKETFVMTQLDNDGDGLIDEDPPNGINDDGDCFRSIGGSGNPPISKPPDPTCADILPLGSWSEYIDEDGPETSVTRDIQIIKTVISGGTGAAVFIHAVICDKIDLQENGLSSRNFLSNFKVTPPIQSKIICKAILLN